MAENYQDLIARGLEPSDVARMVRTNELTRLRRGIYLRATDLTPEQRHRELIEATFPELSKDSVLGHVSAAVLHDLPVPLASLVRVHFTRPRASGRISRYAHRHGAALSSEDTTEIHGLPVTRVERTVGDLSRFLPYPDAVAVVDAALRRRIPVATLEEQVGRGRRRPNNDRFRRALAFGNGLAESPGESRSRVLMAQLNLPMPTLQREFCNARGVVEARTDFDWEDYGTVGEFDGRAKYGRLLKRGDSLERVILYEKQREELLRQHDRWMIRWSSRDLSDPGRFRGLILQGLQSGRSRAGRSGRR